MPKTVDEMVEDLWETVMLGNGDRSLKEQARMNRDHVENMSLLMDGPPGHPELGMVTQVHDVRSVIGTWRKWGWLFISCLLTGVFAAVGGLGISIYDHATPERAKAQPQIIIERESDTVKTDQNGAQSYSQTDSSSTQTTQPAKAATK